jgi:hypothetical protein
MQLHGPTFSSFSADIATKQTGSIRKTIWWELREKQYAQLRHARAGLADDHIKLVGNQSIAVRWQMSNYESYIGED